MLDVLDTHDNGMGVETGGKLPPERVIAIMREERGTGLWPDAVDAAERLIGSSNLGIG